MKAEKANRMAILLTFIGLVSTRSQTIDEQGGHFVNLHRTCTNP